MPVSLAAADDDEEKADDASERKAGTCDGPTPAEVAAAEPKAQPSEPLG